MEKTDRAIIGFYLLVICFSSGKTFANFQAPGYWPRESEIWISEEKCFHNPLQQSCNNLLFTPTQPQALVILTVDKNLSTRSSSIEINEIECAEKRQRQRVHAASKEKNSSINRIAIEERASLEDVHRPSIYRCPERTAMTSETLVRFYFTLCYLTLTRVKLKPGIS